MTQQEEQWKDSETRFDWWDAVYKAKVEEDCDPEISEMFLMESGDRFIAWEILIAVLKGEGDLLPTDSELEEKCGRREGWIRGIRWKNSKLLAEAFAPTKTDKMPFLNTYGRPGK
jgi:hypothetical protein